MLAILIALIPLAGCGQTNDNNTSGEKEEAPAMIDAVIELPEKGEPNEEVAIAVTVSQGKESVEDANEVKFEIWKDGLKDSSEMVEAKHTENGKYSSTYTFPEDGLYHVQSHVTARNMHTMPTETIQIGDVEEGNQEQSEEATEGEHHHHGEVAIQLDKPESIKVNEETPLAVRLEKDEQPLNDANVRLEINKEGSNPAWVDMEEAAEGEYTANYTFTSGGAYLVKIHVQNDEGLHEHTEVEVTVE
jgi:YtkA-like